MNATPYAGTPEHIRTAGNPIIETSVASALPLSEQQGSRERSCLATCSGWVRIEDGLPQHMERVLATYVGVYGHRLVTYWWDGHRGRFGLPTEADERGPQPATHWHRLPPLPNTGDVARPGDGATPKEKTL